MIRRLLGSISATLLSLGISVATGLPARAEEPATKSAPKVISADDINSATPGASDERAVTAKLQVLLDRARFSPGVIDGHMGENVVHALQAFVAQKNVKGFEPDGNSIPPDVLAAIWPLFEAEDENRAIVDYTLTQDDVKGPFTPNIPAGFEAKKSLQRLGYTNVVEMLGEKFHMDVDLLKELNPNTSFDKAGAHIAVANVGRAQAGRVAGKGAPASNDDNMVEETKPVVAKRIEVDKIRKQVRAFDQDGALIGLYPATVGSEEKPAPVGRYEIKGVARNPKYTYNPDYKFKGVKATKPFTIAPGPNNPVGSVWIDLSKEGYGLHGTPEPSEIGKTASHGCVRLTNWDAMELSRHVKPGVEVDFLD